MAESKKQYYLKPQHGTIFINRQKINGREVVVDEKTKKAKYVHRALTAAEVKLFTDEQKKQYLEQR